MTNLNIANCFYRFTKRFTLGTACYHPQTGRPTCFCTKSLVYLRVQQVPSTRALRLSRFYTLFRYFVRYLSVEIYKRLHACTYICFTRFAALPFPYFDRKIVLLYIVTPYHPLNSTCIYLLRQLRITMYHHIP